MTEAVVTDVHRKLKLSNRQCPSVKQVKLVTTLAGSLSVRVQILHGNNNFFQLRVLGLHRSLG